MDKKWEKERSKQHLYYKKCAHLETFTCSQCRPIVSRVRKRNRFLELKQHYFPSQPKRTHHLKFGICLFPSYHLLGFSSAPVSGRSSATDLRVWDLNKHMSIKTTKKNSFLETNKIHLLPLICLWCFTIRFATFAGVSPGMTGSLTSNNPDSGCGLTKSNKTPFSWRNVIWGTPGTQSSLILSSDVGSSE